MDRESVARTNAIKENTRALNALAKEIANSNRLALKIHRDKMGPLKIAVGEPEPEIEGP